MKKYIAPEIVVVEVETQCIAETSQFGIGDGPSKDFAPQSRRSSSWDEYER